MISTRRINALDVRSAPTECEATNEGVVSGVKEHQTPGAAVKVVVAPTMHGCSVEKTGITWRLQVPRTVIQTLKVDMKQTTNDNNTMDFCSSLCVCGREVDYECV